MTLLQMEEESKLRAQVSGLIQELASEKSCTTELQKTLEQSQESHTKLQSDFYGKESEVSALHQDLKVRRRGWQCLCLGRLNLWRNFEHHLTFPSR